MHLKTSSVKWWPFCFNRNVLRQINTTVASPIYEYMGPEPCSSLWLQMYWHQIVLDHTIFVDQVI